MNHLDNALFAWKKAGPRRRWRVLKLSNNFAFVRIRGLLPDGTVVRIAAVAATREAAGELAIAKYEKAVTKGGLKCSDAS